MNAVVRVPYRSRRALHGMGCARNLGHLAGGSHDRNWKAFNSTYPGTTVVNGDYLMPAKFGGVTITQAQLDNLAGTWYGATYHPDGDQAGWQQKFDDVLRSIGAYNAFYGVSATTPVIVSPTPIALIPPPSAPSTPALSIGSQPVGYTNDANGLPVFAGSDGKKYVGQGGQWVIYSGAIAATPPGQSPLQSSISNAPNTPTAPQNQVTPTPQIPATVPVDQTSALIQQLLSQGASQQQAFTAAMQSLAAQGVQATPQLQQQVAADVAQSAAAPSEASTLYVVLGVAALAGLSFFMSRKKRGQR